MSDRYEKLPTDDRPSFDYAENPFSPSFNAPDVQDEQSPSAAVPSTSPTQTTFDRLNVQTEPIGPPAPDGLEFQDFGQRSEIHPDELIQPAPVPALHDDILDSEALLAREEEEKASFYQLAFYRPYFNIETTAVLKRLALSFWPFRTTFLEHVSGRPDLYGPFWIATTLIFLMAALSNFASWISTTQPETWNYDFTLVTIAAATIYSYVALAPLMVFLALNHADAPVTFVQVCCVYGYAMTVFIPAQVLCVIPGEIVRWAVVAVACGMSLLFLGASLWNVIRTSLQGRGILLGLVCVVLHLALAVVMKMVFFKFAEV